MWQVGDEVVIVERDAPDVPCVVERVYRDGSIRAGGRRWCGHGPEHGRNTSARIESAFMRQSTLAHRERIAVLDQIGERLRNMTTDELRAVLASLEVADDR